MFLPFSSEPFNASIAALASESFSISTNPNPLDRPDRRSTTTVAETTLPYALKACFSPSSLTAHGDFPQKVFCSQETSINN